MEIQKIVKNNVTAHFIYGIWCDFVARQIQRNEHFKQFNEDPVLFIMNQ